MGIYDHITPTLPKLPPQDAAHQEHVDRVKTSILERDAVKLGTTYAKLRQMKKEIQQKLSSLQVQIDALEQLLTESQEKHAEGWGQYGAKDNMIRLPNGETIRVQLELYPQVKNKEEYRLWCIKNGYANKLQLWPSTTEALVKERWLIGEPDPDGVETYSKPTVFYTPAKQKDDV
jgi:hypothetical protein